jgi:hypothetical protein
MCVFFLFLLPNLCFFFIELAKNLRCSEDEAEIFLRRFEFDENKILTDYSMNRSHTLKEAGLPPVDFQEIELADKIIECGMCLEDVPYDSCESTFKIT